MAVIFTVFAFAFAFAFADLLTCFDLQNVIGKCCRCCYVCHVGNIEECTSKGARVETPVTGQFSIPR